MFDGRKLSCDGGGWWVVVGGGGDQVRLMTARGHSTVINIAQSGPGTREDILGRGLSL